MRECMCRLGVMGWALLVLALVCLTVAESDAAGSGVWASTRLEAGLRMGYRTLRDDSKITKDASGTVTGGYTDGISIDTLDLDQSYMPYPYVRGFLNDYVGLQIAWDGFTAAALADAQWEELETHQDGDVKVAGPSIQMIFRYPFGPQQRIVPSLGAGVAVLDASFAETAWWGADGVRQIDADDTYGFVMSAGCGFRVTPSCQVDVSWECMMVDVDVEYYFEDNLRADWTFPLDISTLNIGLAYTF